MATGKNKTARRARVKRSARSGARKKSTRLIARAATASEIRKSVGLTRAEMQTVDRLLARVSSRSAAARANG